MSILQDDVPSTFPRWSVALRSNPLIEALGKGLTTEGKSKTLIIGVAMRKLLHLVYGILKSGKPFDPNLLSKVA